MHGNLKTRFAIFRRASKLGEAKPARGSSGSAAVVEEHNESSSPAAGEAARGPSSLSCWRAAKAFANAKIGFGIWRSKRTAAAQTAADKLHLPLRRNESSSSNPRIAKYDRGIRSNPCPGGSLINPM